jgi:beta-N-acetylhexosaminidase
MDLGQLLLIGIEGKQITPDERRFLRDEKIAGVTLFSRNVESPEQIRALCQEIQSCASSPDKPLLISIDNEGGRVLRLKSPFTQWPALKNLGDLDSPQMSYLFAQFMGYELRSVGINTDWAPCVDIFTNPENKVIGDRALGSDPQLVAKHTSSLIRGYLRSGVAPCAKHFPGHGHTLVDSHEDLPQEDLSLERLRQVEMLPFRQAVLSGVPLIMTGHILFRNIDAKNPVTLSHFFLTELLRNELGFDGLIVTDDLDMKALQKYQSLSERVLGSLSAGADFLLFCNEASSPPQALEILRRSFQDKTLSPDRLQKSLNRIHRFQRSYLATPLLPLDWQSVVGAPKHQELVQSILERRI